MKESDDPLVPALAPSWTYVLIGFVFGFTLGVFALVVVRMLFA